MRTNGNGEDEGFIEQLRSLDEISDEIGKLLDQVWYNRHQFLKQKIEEGGETCDPEISEQAEQAARNLEAKYPEGELGPRDDFEWGMINGKLSALRWALGGDRLSASRNYQAECAR